MTKLEQLLLMARKNELMEMQTRIEQRILEINIQLTKGVSDDRTDQENK